MQRGGRLVVIPRMTQVCKECGCSCTSCYNDDSLDLHHEIEELRSKLKKSESHVLQMERDFIDSREYAENEISKLQDELAKLRDRYDRLLESHKKLQRVNHNLEDKLLKVVNKFDGEKTNLEQEVADITTKLVDSKALICELEEENERFRNDCNIAVQLLQCKPSNFIAHKLNTLPIDLQERVKPHLTRDQWIELEEGDQSPPETKMIRVPMPTFPPTAMVYSINKAQSAASSNNSTPAGLPNSAPRDLVPSSLIAKVLTPSQVPRKPRRIYVCTKCKTDTSVSDVSVQTVIIYSMETNGFNGNHPTRTTTHFGVPHPGVHRPRLNSTETEI